MSQPAGDSSSLLRRAMTELPFSYGVFRIPRRMTYNYCAEHCIAVPADFPIEEERELMNLARKRFSSEADVWREFAGGTNLLAWRFRSVYEAWNTYCHIWIVSGGRPDHEQMYVQERALFETFAAAISCVESLVYSIAAALSSPSVLSLPFGPDKQRQCSPSKLRDWLRSHASAVALCDALTELVDSREWDILLRVRNRLSHRGNLPRITFGAIGSVPPPPNAIEFDKTTSTPRLSGDLTFVDIHLMWLTFAITSLTVLTREVIQGSASTTSHP